MPSDKPTKLRCFLAIPFTRDFEEVRKAIKTGVERARFEIVAFDEQPVTGSTIRKSLMGVLAQSDCIVADLTNRNPNVHFELGIAQAMGKAVFPLVRIDAFDQIPFDLRDMQAIAYEPSPAGLLHLSTQITRHLDEFRHSPRKAQFASGGRVSTPFFIDWDRLDLSDAENLCRELLSQLGLRRLDWFKGSREFDLIAEYPRKDPDGFEYRELWVVSMGRNIPTEMFLGLADDDIELFVHRALRGDERFERMWSGDENISVTLLLIALKETTHPEEFEMIRERLSRRSRTSRYPFSIRVRLWDREYLTTLVQQFPNIGYKYFSDEARSHSKFRKGPEELYEENLVLSERLATTNAELEDEKNRRVRAERDAVWKDISFSAAHKIGNPIFAIETDLDPLAKRIAEDRKEEAVEVVANIRGAVEKAKSIVDQFKSLTKAQEVKPVPTLLRPILEDCCKVPKAQNVECRIECPQDVRVVGDPDRLAEVFDELASNALHWLDKSKKEIKVEVTIPELSALPAAVDSDRKYALVRFRDNGPGVSFENKSRVFEAFFSTYDHGTGLGLALVRRIIEGHGGVILESGIPGKGADFEIYLPLAEDAKK